MTDPLVSSVCVSPWIRKYNKRRDKIKKQKNGNKWGGSTWADSYSAASGRGRDKAGRSGRVTRVSSLRTPGNFSRGPGWVLNQCVVLREAWPRLWTNLEHDLVLYTSRSRPWNLKCESLKYRYTNLKYCWLPEFPHPPPLLRLRHDIFSGAVHRNLPYGALNIFHAGGSVVGVGVICTYTHAYYYVCLCLLCLLWTLLICCYFCYFYYLYYCFIIW